MPVGNIEKYYELQRTEIDIENLFFSTVSKAKEKGIFEEAELIYIDKTLGLTIEEAARLCGKGYIKEDNARVMLKNIFMILDSTFSPSEISEIISCIKERRLWEAWQRGVRESIAAFDRTKKNFFHLEHFYYANPTLLADFAIKLKNDYAFTNIYTHGFDRAKFTKAFFLLSEQESFRSVCERSEVLCCECGFLGRMKYEDLLPMLRERGLERADGGIKYTAPLLDAITLSMCFAAFYRCDGFYPKKVYAKDILSELVASEESELAESLESYIRMACARYGIEIADKSASVGENILNVYATRMCDENISLLAKHLARTVVRKRNTENGLKILINFA